MITVFGSINMDLAAVVSRLPRPGETVTGSAFFASPGGKGANQALAARRAESSVIMAGAVGTDDFGKSALKLMVEAGVDTSHVKRQSCPTGTAHILVDADGENQIAVVPGANGTLDVLDVKNAFGNLGVGDFAVFQLEVPAEVTELALVEARRKGATTILNIAPFIRDAYRLSQFADIVIANEIEFEELIKAHGVAKNTHEVLLQRLHSVTGRTYVVTLGAEGVVAIHLGKIIYAKGLSIKPVDTVGAGDTFCGYFAASLDQGLSFELSLQRAAIAGSLACLSEGAQNSIPISSAVDHQMMHGEP